MEAKNLKSELKAACLAAADLGLTVPEIDLVPEVDHLITTLYPIAHLIKMARHHIIRGYIQDEVDRDGVRTRVAIVQPQLPLAEGTDCIGGRRRNAVYMSAAEVQREPALTVSALLSVRKDVCGRIRKSSVLPLAARVKLLSEIDAIFDRLIGEM